MRSNDEETRRILYVGCVLTLTALAFAVHCPNAALVILCFAVLA